LTAPHAGRPVELSPLTQTQLPIGEERDYLSRFDDLFPADTTIRKRFLAMTAVLDDEVGRIVDALDRNGLMEHTVIWFTSDNGPATQFGGMTGGLRGRKHTPYEGGLRVPSFVVWEGHIAPGTSNQVVGNVDVMPTLLRLVQAHRRPRGSDGLDLSGPLLGGPVVERGLAVPNTVFGDAYRLRQWKYVRLYEAGAEPELYDLAADPAETTDLAAVYPDTLALLASLMPYGPELQCTALVKETPELRPELVVFPNPAAFPFAELAMPTEGPACLEVFDVRGRLIAVLHDGPAPAGVLKFELGEIPLGSGVYVMRATAGKTAVSRVFTVVR
jgi:hypothetical protein